MFWVVISWTQSLFSRITHEHQSIVHVLTMFSLWLYLIHVAWIQSNWTNCKFNILGKYKIALKFLLFPCDFVFWITLIILLKRWYKSPPASFIIRIDFLNVLVVHACFFLLKVTTYIRWLQHRNRSGFIQMMCKLMVCFIDTRLQRKCAKWNQE